MKLPITLIFFLLVLKLNGFQAAHKYSNHLSPCYELYSSGFTEMTNLDSCYQNKFYRTLDMVIFVLSAVDHFQQRMIIRNTWGSYRNLRVLFSVGKTKIYMLERKLRAEQFHYEDLIQGNFYDSYSNLTLKTLSILEYSFKYCNGARFIVKCDDDIFLNVPKLKNFVSIQQPKRTIIGEMRNRARPFRNKNSKYYLSFKEYKNKILPSHLAGATYLIPQNVIEEMYRTASREPCFKLEDVFITGIIPNLTGINLLDSELFRPYRQLKHWLKPDSFINLHADTPRKIKQIFTHYRRTFSL